MSVSPIDGLILVASMPNTSASCIETAVLDPPISGEPSTKLIVPSAVTLAIALDGPLPLNQKPEAIPLPRYGPSNLLL